MEKRKHIDTICVQDGYTPKAGEPRVAPIVQSTTFVYDDPKELADLFDLKKSGYFYTRLGNPTCGFLEEKLSKMDGGIGALACSSGQSASTLAVLNVCSAGDNFICVSAIYGGTYNLFDVTLRKLGIDARFVSPDASAADIESKIDGRTKLIFGETIANPAINILDFAKFAKLAKKYGILFAVDNTLATPIHCRPVEFGANIVVYSSTKYLDGHATSVGGIIVDLGNFEFKENKRYADFNAPDNSYHGINYAKDCGAGAFIIKARVQLMRDLGACMSPQNAFYTILGCETLHLRMERTSFNALKVAEFLENQPQIEFVKYPFLKSGKTNYALAKKYLSGGAGGMISFGVKGGRAKAEELIKKLKLCKLVTHVADSRSCVIHNASTTHRQLSDKALIEAGVLPNQIRFSAGTENIADILADLEQALLGIRE